MRKLLSKKKTEVTGCELLIYDLKDQSVLFTKREDVPVWVLPGGGIENGESPVQCVIREVKEEVGINPGKPILFAKYLSRDNRFKYSYFSIYKNERIKMDQDEISGYEWFKIFDLPSYLPDYQRAKLLDFLHYLISKKVITRTHKVYIYKEICRLLIHPIYFIQIVYLYIINRFTKKTFRLYL